MAQTIKLKRSSVQNNVPSTSDLELGELAINTYDGKLFIKKDDGSASIVQVGGIVGTSELTDGSVTTSKIANDAVNADKLADNSVGIAALNVSDGSNGQVLTTNGNGTLSFSTVSGGGSQNLFQTVRVSGQSDLVADSTTDVLTFAAGSGISLATTPGTDTLTITSTATGSVTEAFKTIAVSGQNNVVADSATDTLTFVAGSNMTITTNASNDTVTFASSGSGASGNTGGIDSQIFNGDGTDTTFTLTTAPTSEDHLWVFVDGVYQNKDSYSINGTTLTMGTAPDNGTKLAVHHVRVGTPGTGAITAAMLASPLSLSGDFAVDTNVLKVDSSNNRVGINVTTPSHPLDVVGNINVTSGNIITDSNVLVGSQVAHVGDTDTRLEFGTNDIKLVAGGATHFQASSDQTTRVFGGNAAAIVINSAQKVSIGSASPTVSLDVGTKTDAIRVPIGTTAQRPTGAQGLFRYNTTDGQFEGYTDSWGAIAGSGGGSSSTFLKQEFTGNGSTTAFTLQVTVTSEDNLIVFNEGVFQRQDSYAASGTTITFDTAPANGNKVVVYQMETGVVGVAPVVDTMTGDGSDTTLTLSTTPASENQTFLTVDGVMQHKSTYSISGTTLTFSSPPPNGSNVECITLLNSSVKVIADTDGDTQIQLEESTDEDKIRFDTGGFERVVIDSTGASISGNIVGTGNIEGGSSSFLRFAAGSSTTPAILFGDSSGTGGTLSFKRNSDSAVAMAIDADGDVAISKDLTITGNLTVSGTTTEISTTNLQVEDKNIVLNYGSGNTSSNADGAGITIQDAVDSSTDATLNWSTTNDRFVMSHGLQVTSGNVGIGTASPSTSLEVVSSGNDNGIQLEGSGGDTLALLHQQSTDAATLRLYDGGSVKILIGSNANSDSYFNSGGNVGIGTTSPLTKLDVVRGGATGLSSVNSRTVALFQNNLSNGAVISVNAPNTGYSGIFLGDPQNEAQGQIKQVHTDNSMQFCTQGGATEMTLKASSLGLGVTSPSQRLDVRGGNIMVGGYNSGSDYGLILTPADSASYWHIYNDAGGHLDFGRDITVGGQRKVRFSSAGNVELTGNIQHTGLTMTDGTDIDQLKTYAQTLTVGTSYIDTGINGADLQNGVYLVSLDVNDYAVGGGHYSEKYSGIMSWYSANTNSGESDEIALHRAGHAPNAGVLYLRTLRTVSADTDDLKLQIKANYSASGSSTYTFKFRRMI